MSQLGYNYVSSHVFIPHLFRVGVIFSNVYLPHPSDFGQEHQWINGLWLDTQCIPDIIVAGLIVIDNVSVLHIYGRVHVHIFIKGVLLSTW